MDARYLADALTDFAASLLAAAGLESDKARVTAEVLVEGDLLGHTTHGLQLLAPYLDEAAAGRMTGSGEPKVIADFPAAATWDGRRLPGCWLTVKGVDLAIERAKTLGTATVVIRRSHHIGCLAVYGRRAADRGMMLLMACSDPTVAGLAPHGGIGSVFSPNPISAAWPTAKGPVIVDVSQSIVALGTVKRAQAEGRKLAGPWLLDPAGQPTDDPSVISAKPPGTLLPSGGLDHGHKGYAFALLVEALTGGLAGHGRADPGEGWTATTYIQIFDPALYAGEAEFERQMTWVTEACHQSRPLAAGKPVRLPGERGLQRRDEQLKNGVALYPGIMPALKPWMERFQIAAPAAL